MAMTQLGNLSHSRQWPRLEESPLAVSLSIFFSHHVHIAVSFSINWIILRTRTADCSGREKSVHIRQEAISRNYVKYQICTTIYITRDCIVLGLAVKKLGIILGCFAQSG